MLRVKHCYSV